MKKSITWNAPGLLTILRYAVVVAILTSATQSLAIERLQVTVQGSNAVLSWPSSSNQNYQIRYMPLLGTNAQWIQLANNYPGASNTNWTTFIHSNIVQYPDGGSGGGGGTNWGPPNPEGMSAAQTTTTTDISTLTPEQIAALREELRRQSVVLLEELKAKLYTAVVEAEERRQAWLAAGRPRTQYATRTMSMTESEGQSITNAGFYSVEPMTYGFVMLTNGTVLSNTVAIDISAFPGGTNVLTSVELLDIYQGKTNLIGSVTDQCTTNARSW